MASCEEFTDEPIIDCSTISVSAQARGLFQISFDVYVPKDYGVPYTGSSSEFSLCLGGVRYTGFITSQDLSDADLADHYQWKVSATAVGCRDSDCSSTCG